MKTLFIFLAVAGIVGAAIAQQTNQPSQLGTEKGPAARRVVYTKANFGATITTNVLTLEDVPGHKLTQSFRVDRGKSTDAEFGIAEEYIYWQGDERPGEARYEGYSTYLMLGGDKVFIRWKTDSAPQGPVVGGEPVIESGAIVIIGGTGRYRNIQGRGVYRGYAKGPMVEENILDVSW